MRIKSNDSGFTMWLSANDTYKWATNPNNRWPCSTMSDHRFVIVVDSNGLCDFSRDGQDDTGQTDGNELSAIVGDFLPKHLDGFWPT